MKVPYAFIEISLYTMCVYIMGDGSGLCCLLVLTVRCGGGSRWWAVCVGRGRLGDGKKKSGPTIYLIK